MENTKEFEHFDVVSDDSDHHFLGSKNGKWLNDSKSKVHKTIVKEWKILEQNLPESIYVRVYERSIDLMRAVIVGAAGTPYHDGLFFFDIMFPSDYPRNPPKLYYHSFGYRHNPNLYKNGKVCLSLLNTWYGRKKEKWDPCESTMLQVLLSIQALVLNEKPFFNEPDAVPSEKKSRAYNENVFLSTCITSFHLLQPAAELRSLRRRPFSPPSVSDSRGMRRVREWARGSWVLRLRHAFLDGPSFEGFQGAHGGALPSAFRSVSSEWCFFGGFGTTVGGGEPRIPRQKQWSFQKDSGKDKKGFQMEEIWEEQNQRDRGDKSWY